jgi:hypothetical protein
MDVSTSKAYAAATAAGPAASAPRKPLLLVAGALVPLVALLAACGAGAGASASTPSGGASSAPSSPTGGRGGLGGAFPGASGLIAAASPGTLQVQGAAAQTTVTYTKATRFSQTVSVKVAVGDCVTVTGTPVAGSTQALTASSVRIDAKVGGTCALTGGAGGFGGGFGGGTRPSGAPTGSRPSGAPTGGFGGTGRGNLASAMGTVSAVNGSTVTVNGLLRQGRSAGGATATPSAAATAIAVTVPGSVAVTQTVAATSAAAVVGKCATAIGKTDTRGDLAATTITISTPTAAGCRAGFGGRFGQGGGGSGTGGGSITNG